MLFVGMPVHENLTKFEQILRNVKFGANHVMTWFQGTSNSVKTTLKNKSCTLKFVKIQLNSKRILCLVGVRETSWKTESGKTFYKYKKR